MTIVANKIPIGRAAAVNGPYPTERARACNNTQIITRGSQSCNPEVAKKHLDILSQAEFQDGRSTKKVVKIDHIDERYQKP